MIDLVISIANWLYIYKFVKLEFETDSLALSILINIRFLFFNVVFVIDVELIVNEESIM